MPITDKEKVGLQDLFLHSEQNMYIAVQVARSVTKNICDIASGQEALDYIFTHVGDTIEILSKRAITKELLFKYLHAKRIPLKSNKEITKYNLIEKIKEFWNANESISQLPITENINNVTQNTVNNDSISGSSNSISGISNGNNNIQISNSSNKLTEQFVQQFTVWFFEKLNNDDLQALDVWPDIQLVLNVVTNEHNDFKNLIGANDVVDLLIHSRIQNNIKFNPNLTPNGIQGRMDNFGMFLVVNCGTVHNTDNCIGVYAATFGLIRDPYADNNWKVKKIQLNLKTTTTTALPSIYDIDDFRAILALPLNSDDDIN